MNQTLTISEAYTQATSLRNYLQTHQLSLGTFVFLAEADSVRLLKQLDCFIDGVEDLLEVRQLLEVA